ncbi:MAG: hypothetical protein M3461_11985 [Pseudomonadota bacterium]|nr:hypothetical protein [Pseudomonadota bacterium]
MSIHQTVTFQEALDIERTRDMLSKRIEEARQELSRGEVRRGTVDDLSLEIEQVRNNPELLAFLAERSREKETFSLEDVKRKLGL